MKKQKEQREQHPILNQVLTPEFLKQFKNSKDLNGFIDEFLPEAWSKCWKVSSMVIWAMPNIPRQGSTRGTQEMANPARPLRPSEANYR